MIPFKKFLFEEGIRTREDADQAALRHRRLLRGVHPRHAPKNWRKKEEYISRLQTSHSHWNDAVKNNPVHSEDDHHVVNTGRADDRHDFYLAKHEDKKDTYFTGHLIKRDKKQSPYSIALNMHKITLNKHVDSGQYTKIAEIVHKAWQAHTGDNTKPAPEPRSAANILHGKWGESYISQEKRSSQIRAVDRIQDKINHAGDRIRDASRRTDAIRRAQLQRRIKRSIMLRQKHHKKKLGHLDRRLDSLNRRK